MHDMLKRRKKNIQKISKAKRIKMLLNMIASPGFLGDVRVIECISKVIVPIKQL